MRILSLAPSNTEILFALGAGRQVVACTTYCDYPEGAQKLPKVGGWTTVSADLVKRFDPDVVLTSTIVQGESKLKFKNEKFQVIHFDVRTLADIYDSIKKMGKLVGKLSNAKRLTQEIKSKFERLASSVERSARPKVYIIEEWFDPPMASGNWVTELVELAGGKPILKKREISRKVTLSKVEGFDPDLIILAYCGYMDKSDPAIIKKRWPDLRAVKDNKVFVIDERILNRPGPRIWLAAQKLRKICTSSF